MKSIIKAPLRLENWFRTDARLHQLYPESVRSLARMHWSPLYIIQKAIPYLTPNDKVKVLDIGSGVGTFCLAGAYYKQSVPFYGVEQRKKLIEVAEGAREKLGIQNVSFIHGNFTQLNLNEFDHFYFYNSFFECIPGTDKIDDSIAYSPELYHYYSRYLRLQLDEMPAGTRVVTYCSWNDEIPPGYRLVESDTDQLLKFWEKQS